MKPLLFVLMLLALLSCDKILLGDETPLISLDKNLALPPLLNDGWQISTMEAEKINKEPIHTLIKNLQKESRNIHSLLIFRNNKLVSESYFDGWHRNRLHASRSASKSFMSTLIGIAIDKGKIKSVDEALISFFPEYAVLSDMQKSQITLKHLLTMTTGLAWDEATFPAGDIRNDQYALDQNTDRLGYLFNKNMIALPSEKFEYNSANPVVEAAILQKAIGINAKDFAHAHFFTPLDIKDYYWRNNKDGFITSVGPILLQPRDFAKLGQLFLDGGKWKGKQIISKRWVDEATSTFTGTESNSTGYGYHWWVSNFTLDNKEARMYFAQGSGGQYIYVMPSLNAVVVFTGGNYPPKNQGITFGLLRNTILPAMH
jgi:CubicO group peptidase (beta-lactamase class C family)